VLGWPLNSTLSPVIHRAAFGALGIPWTYLAWPMLPERLAAAIEGLRALGAVGANVTMPHKEPVIVLLDEVSAEARSLGAVNTISRVGETLVGHNTDVAGFSASLQQSGVDMLGRSALVLGAGGAARAVVRALDQMGANDISVCARRPEAAVAVTGLADNVNAVAWERREESAKTAALVVNATPLSAVGGDPLSGARFRPGQVVVDLVYVPAETELLRRARAEGAQAVGGLGMLIHQAAASLRIWTGLEPPLEAMERATMPSGGEKTI
jgi:shikimate dehydrogenase